MTKENFYIESNQTDPYYNLGLEEYLLDHVEDNQVILYLWQNRHTVVIGKNQNSWKECKIRELEADGGFLVRRLSGGGAVFHDMGNLNFTFLVPSKDYDLDKQLEVILSAVRMLGLDAVKSGRNDITIHGMKFSGNAFYERKGKSYHHGTLMVNVVKEDMLKYLNVDQEKLKSKSVDSVKARVTNLSEFYPGLTIEQLKEKLIKAFGQVYQMTPRKLDLCDLPKQSIKEREKRFASWDFKYGKKIQFQFEASKRFQWGDICIQLKVESGKIKDALVFSDAMNQKLISEIEPMFLNLTFDQMAIINSLNQLTSTDENEAVMISDIKNFISEQDF